MKISLNELANFIIEAKKNTYAIGNKNVVSERKNFDELEYNKGKWNYRDSYYGFFRAPGQEFVRFEDEPIWAMAYNGGMREEFLDDIDFAKKTYSFLKKALALVDKKRPFRGPTNFKEGDFVYEDSSIGDLKEFKGTEIIFYKGKEVFRQDYIGGIVINKKSHVLKE